ncbi:lipoate-protein ligase A [Staphylococcus aureus]|nr:lipoate-protein ligase A [Staphylococcus aureus]
MKFISNNNITDPTLNLAMEEYVFKKFTSRRKLLFILHK